MQDKRPSFTQCARDPRLDRPYTSRRLLPTPLHLSTSSRAPICERVLLSALAWVQWKWRGARGCVLKSDVGRGLLAAVKALSRHEAFFSSSVSEMVLKDCQAHDGHLEHGHRCHAWQLQVLLLASGSEVYPCVDAHEKLKAR
jgi:hypothetical protein